MIDSRSMAIYPHKVYIISYILTKNNYLAFLHSVSGTQKMVCCYRWQTPETSAHSQNVWFSLAIRRTVCLSSRGFMATWGALL